MVKFIKLFKSGVASLNIERFKLVKRDLKDEEHNDLELDVDLEYKRIYDADLGLKVDKKMLIDYIKYYGIENIYIGEKVNHYSNGELRLRNMQGEEMLPESWKIFKKSLFKHDENDYYYYDLLDNNKRYEHINPGAFYISNGCDNMKSITSILDKTKEKVRR